MTDNAMRNIVVALTLLVSIVPAFAGTRVWISEFATVRPEAAAPFANLPSTINYSMDIGQGPKTSNVFLPGTRFIRIVCEIQCTITTKPNTATPNDILLPALLPQYFGVVAGGQISVAGTP